MSNFDETKVNRQARGTSGGGQFDYKERLSNDGVSLASTNSDLQTDVLLRYLERRPARETRLNLSHESAHHLTQGLQRALDDQSEAVEAMMQEPYGNEGLKESHLASIYLRARSGTAPLRLDDFPVGRGDEMHSFAARALEDGPISFSPVAGRKPHLQAEPTIDKALAIAEDAGLSAEDSKQAVRAALKPDVWMVPTVDESQDGERFEDRAADEVSQMLFSLSGTHRSVTQCDSLGRQIVTALDPGRKERVRQAQQSWDSAHAKTQHIW